MPIYNALVHDISLEEIKRYAGLAKCPEFSSTLLEQVKQEIQLLAKIKGIWQLYEYEATGGVIVSTPPLTIDSHKLIQHLANCDKVVVMAVTIGADIEQAIQQHFAQGDYTAALLLDAAATTMVETAADQFNAYIDYLAKNQGYLTVYRFSPGYGEWNVAVQQEVLKLAQAQDIQITASPSSMLIPRKSVTAVIGWTRVTPKTQKTCRHACQECSQLDCLARK